MAGTYFDYQPGRIEAKFSHDEKFDFVTLGVRLVGDVTTATACDDRGTFADPVGYQSDPVEFSLYFSSVYCPFRDFLRFLEAVSIEVQECGFEWDAEGPSGKMKWRRRFVKDTGFLTMEWQSADNRFSHRTMLNTRQAVKTLYESFRAFVDSEDYDPLRYEKLTNGEEFQLVMSDASLYDLELKLAALDAQSAHSAITRLRTAAGARHSEGPKASFPLSYFFEREWSELPLTEWDSWIPEDWDTLGQGKRADALRELFGWGSLGWYGANLRELRSSTVEAWLSEPEPPPRRSYRIPVKSDVEARNPEGLSSDGSL